MDPDNLERLMAIIDLLDRFKERMTQATIRRRTTIVPFRGRSGEGDADLSIPSRSSQDLIGFGSRDLEKLPTAIVTQRMATLTTMMSKGRSLAFMASQSRRKSVHFGGEAKEENDMDSMDFSIMFQQSVSRAMSRAVSGKKSMNQNFARSMSRMIDRSATRLDRTVSKGWNVADRQRSRLDRQSTLGKMDTQSATSSEELLAPSKSSKADRWSPNTAILKHLNENQSTASLGSTVNEDGFSRHGSMPSRQAFLDHKLEAGLFSDPEVMTDVDEPPGHPFSSDGSTLQESESKELVANGMGSFSKQLKRSPRRSSPKRGKKKQRGSVMFADVSNLNSAHSLTSLASRSLTQRQSSSLESWGTTDSKVTGEFEDEADLQRRLIEEFGEEAAMHVAASNPEVLQQLFSRITAYIKDDLGRLLDELLARMQQTELRLQQTEQHLHNAMEKTEYHEVETAQIQVQLNELKASKEENKLKTKQIQRQLEELDATRGKLQHMEAQLELQKQQTSRLQRVKDEELQQLKQAIQEKESEIQKTTQVYLEGRLEEDSQALGPMDTRAQKISVGSPTDEGILKFPTRGRRHLALNPVWKPIEPSFTFNVQRDVSPCETENEASQPQTPRQSLIIDEMARRISDLEVEVRNAEIAERRVEELEGIIDDLTMKVETINKEKFALEQNVTYLKSEQKKSEIKELQEQLQLNKKEIDELIEAKEKAQQDVDDAKKCVDETLRHRNQLIDKLELIEEKWERETHGVKQKYDAELRALNEMWQTKYDEIKREYASMSKQYNDAKRENAIMPIEFPKMEQLGQLEIKLAEMEIEVERDKREITDLRNELIRRDEEREHLISEMVTGTKQAEIQQNLLKAELEASLEQKNSELAALQLKIETSENDFNAIKEKYASRIEELEKSIDVIREQSWITLSERNAGVETVQKEMSLAFERMRELERDADKERQTATALTGENKILKEELSFIDAERNRMRIEINKFKEERETEREAFEVRMLQLASENLAKGQVISEFKEKMLKLKVQLEKSSLLGEDSEMQMPSSNFTASTSEESQLVLDCMNGLSQMIAKTKNLLENFEEAKRDLEIARERIRNQEEELDKWKRAAAENESTRDRLKSMELVEEFTRTATELKQNLVSRDVERRKLQETCEVMSSRVRELEEEQMKGAQNYNDLEQELIKLRKQFQDLRTERKMTEEHLAHILARLQGREFVSIDFHDKIIELQESLREAENALELTKQELDIEKSKPQPDAYDLRMMEMQKSITCLLEGRALDKNLWVGQVEHFQRENVQLRARLATLTALLSSLNERLSQLQSVTSPSPCCRFLLGTCCPDTTTNASLSEQAVFEPPNNDSTEVPFPTFIRSTSKDSLTQSSKSNHSSHSPLGLHRAMWKFTPIGASASIEPKLSKEQPCRPSPFTLSVPESSLRSSGPVVQHMLAKRAPGTKLDSVATNNITGALNLAMPTFSSSHPAAGLRLVMQS